MWSQASIVSSVVIKDRKDRSSHFWNTSGSDSRILSSFDRASFVSGEIIAISHASEVKVTIYNNASFLFIATDNFMLNNQSHWFIFYTLVLKQKPFDLANGILFVVLSLYLKFSAVRIRFSVCKHCTCLKRIHNFSVRLFYEKNNWKRVSANLYVH